MSHEITAHIPGQKEPIATLNINGFKRRMTKLYTVLNAEDLFRQDSGSGDTRFYTRTELIKSANTKVAKEELTEMEKKFLLHVTELCNGRGINITFA